MPAQILPNPKPEDEPEAGVHSEEYWCELGAIGNGHGKSLFSGLVDGGEVLLSQGLLGAERADSANGSEDLCSNGGSLFVCLQNSHLLFHNEGCGESVDDKDEKQ